MYAFFKLSFLFCNLSYLISFCPDDLVFASRHPGIFCTHYHHDPTTTTATTFNTAQNFPTATTHLEGTIRWFLVLIAGILPGCARVPGSHTPDKTDLKARAAFLRGFTKSAALSGLDSLPTNTWHGSRCSFSTFLSLKNVLWYEAELFFFLSYSRQSYVQRFFCLM